MSVLWASLGLAIALGLGALAGRTRLFRDDEPATEALSRYVLYVAFPALVAAQVVDPSFVVPREPAFYLAVPLVFGATLALAALTAREHVGTVALVVGFGNVAFVGLPVVEATLGPSALPLASLAVALHVAVGLTLGPYVLLRAAGRATTRGAIARRLATQPLFWAPLAGVAMRWLPDAAREALVTLATPFGRSASPVALFVLGLYLYGLRDRLRSIDRGDVAHVGLKLLAQPALTFALCLACRQAGWLDVSQARVLTLLAAMPAAVSCFVIAHELETRAERVARTVLTTCLAATITVPLVAYAITRVWP